MMWLLRSHRVLAAALDRQAERCVPGSASEIGFRMMATAYRETADELQKQWRELHALGCEEDDG